MSNDSAHAIASKWLNREPNNQSRARIFCLPYSGCGASMFRKWPNEYHGMEICAVQLPGRENRIRERNYSTYEELANNMIEAIMPYLDGNFAFFGHCGSALLAYETAIQLQQRKGPMPSRLFISSQVTPHEGPYGRFLQLSEEELFDEVERLTIEMGGTLIPDLTEMAVSILKSDIEMNKRYYKEKTDKMPCEITAIGWDEDKEVNYQLMKGWKEYESVKLRLLHGSHYTFLSAPESLMKVIHEDLFTPTPDKKGKGDQQYEFS